MIVIILSILSLGLGVSWGIVIEKTYEIRRRKRSRKRMCESNSADFRW